MERSSIKTTKKWVKQDLTQGVFIELSCSMCMEEVILAATTKGELQRKVVEEGWRNLYSDLYGLEGWWCGCDYKDND